MLQGNHFFFDNTQYSVTGTLRRHAVVVQPQRCEARRTMYRHLHHPRIATGCTTRWRAKREQRSLLAVSAEIGLGSDGTVNISECSQPSSRGSELKRLISSNQNGSLASSGASNSPDTDDAQPVERADLTRLLCRMHGTRKPRTPPEARGKEQRANHHAPVATCKLRGRRNRKAR